MTLFSNFLPLEAMPAIFDSMSLDGWTAIYRISISLLKVMEKDLLEMDMVTMCQYFREASHYGFIDLWLVMSIADWIDIDEDVLRYYSQQKDVSKLNDGDVSPVMEPDRTFTLGLELVPERTQMTCLHDELDEIERKIAA